METTSSKQLTIYFFSAGWCNKSQKLRPVLTHIIKEFEELVELKEYNIDIEAHKQLSIDLGVKKIPEIKILKYNDPDNVLGSYYDNISGSNEIRSIIKKHLNNDNGE